MAQEKMLAMSRMTSTVKAMGPLLWTISMSALECGPDERTRRALAVSCRKRARGRTVICSDFSVNARDERQAVLAKG